MHEVNIVYFVRYIFCYFDISFILEILTSVFELLALFICVENHKELVFFYFFNSDVWPLLHDFFNETVWRLSIEMPERLFFVCVWSEVCINYWLVYLNVGSHRLAQIDVSCWRAVKHQSINQSINQSIVGWSELYDIVLTTDWCIWCFNHRRCMSMFEHHIFIPSYIRIVYLIHFSICVISGWLWINDVRKSKCFQPNSLVLKNNFKTKNGFRIILCLEWDFLWFHHSML